MINTNKWLDEVHKGKSKDGGEKNDNKSRDAEEKARRMRMKEIGHTLNLSESRVSQMHSSIVRRLQFQLQKREPEFLT